MGRRSRQGRVDLTKTFMLLTALALAYAAWAFLPHFWVERKMDEVVTVTLLEWRDKTRKRSEDRLVKELNDREIPDYILADDCEFYEQGGEKHLECYWAVDVKYPLVDKRTTLEFYCHQYLDDRDGLHDWEKE